MSKQIFILDIKSNTHTHTHTHTHTQSQLFVNQNVSGVLMLKYLIFMTLQGKKKFLESFKSPQTKDLRIGHYIKT